MKSYRLTGSSVINGPNQILMTDRKSCGILLCLCSLVSQRAHEEIIDYEYY